MGYAGDNPKEVLKTIAYFDSVDMPLTPSEIWMNLFKGDRVVMLEETNREIASLVEQGIAVATRGFVVLQGRELLIDERIKREGHAIFKYRTLHRIIWWLRFVPFIRMVATCNTLAFDMARKEGDSDLFIVAKRNRLYLCRLFVTGLLHVLRLRRHGLHIANRICLSFYVDEDGFDMSRFALPDGDPYLVQWTRRVVPLFSINSTYERFWKTNLPWLQTKLQDPMPYNTIPLRRVPESMLSKIKRTAFEFVLWPIAPLLEWIARRYERGHMRQAPYRHIRLTDTGVIIDDHTLKFHEEDRRKFFRDRMQQTLQRIHSTHVV